MHTVEKLRAIIRKRKLTWTDFRKNTRTQVIDGVEFIASGGLHYGRRCIALMAEGKIVSILKIEGGNTRVRYRLDPKNPYEGFHLTIKRDFPIIKDDADGQCEEGAADPSTTEKAKITTSTHTVSGSESIRKKA